MPKTVRNIICLVGAGVIALVLVVVYMAGVSGRAPLKCLGLKVEIADSSVNSFVSEADIKKYLEKEYGAYIGEPLDSINLSKIEDIIEGRSAVHKSQAYTTNDGMLNIRVTQRTPVVRFQRSDGGFYADSEGYLFPLQNSYSSRVPIVDGDIPLKANSGYKGEPGDEKERLWLSSVLEVINYMESTKEWKDKFVQITVRDGGELIFVPREGKEKFHFGQPEDIETKFEKIRMYYSHILPEKGAEKYSIVNVEYDGQIVCK